MKIPLSKESLDSVTSAGGSSLGGTPTSKIDDAVVLKIIKDGLRPSETSPTPAAADADEDGVDATKLPLLLDPAEVVEGVRGFPPSLHTQFCLRCAFQPASFPRASIHHRLPWWSLRPPSATQSHGTSTPTNRAACR